MVRFKQLSLLLALCQLINACNIGNNATIKGTFSGVDKKTVYLDYITTSNITPTDSAVTDEKGRFKFRVKLKSDSPSFYNVRYQNQTISMLLAPGESVEVKSLGNLARNYTVTGSEGSVLLKDLNSMMNHTQKCLDSLADIYVRIDEFSMAERRRVLDEYTKMFVKHKQDIIKFIVTNPNSMASIYALYQKMPNGDNVFGSQSDMLYFKLLADSLSVRYPASPHVVSLQRDAQQMENAAKLENMIMDASGASTSYPDIDMPDMHGKRIKLSSIKNSVIFVDFWSAEDPNARLLNAELKELYKEYKDKGFEIYQISLDTSKSTWVSAVNDQRLPWVSVCDFSGTATTAVRLYNITSIPANVLISADGQIIARNISVEQLESRLKTLF